MDFTKEVDEILNEQDDERVLTLAHDINKEVFPWLCNKDENKFWEFIEKIALIIKKNPTLRDKVVKEYCEKHYTQGDK